MTEAVVHGNFAIEIFDPAVTTWNRWLQRFEGAVTVFKVADTQKVAYFLHFIGPASFDLICDKLAPADPYKQPYTILTDKLAEFYSPIPLEIAENFRFHQRKQQEGETVQQFVATLQKLSLYCNFGSYLQTALRNHMVFGLRSKRIQSRLLEMRNLTFEKAVETAVSMELSEKDANQLQAIVPTSVDYVNQKEAGISRKNNIGSQKKKFRREKPNFTNATAKFKRNTAHAAVQLGNLSGNVTCYRCGGKHLASNCTLNRETVCLSCGGKGHIQRVCMKKSKASVNPLSEILCVQGEHQEYRGKYYTTMIVDKVPVRFEIDSGAAVTIISRKFLRTSFPDVLLKLSDLRLITFCKTTIPVCGYVEVQVHYNGREKKLHMYVSETDRDPLLGREWIQQLKVQLADTAFTLNTFSLDEINAILREYEQMLDLCDTSIKDVQARFTLKENTRPVFLKARKVPFKLMPMVEKEINRLVTEVDEHPLPTIDELFYSLSGGQKFSKIDLKQAYLQMQVHPDDQEFLTLNTHKDDIRVTGPNDRVHLERLKEDSICYCGYRIDKVGIHKEDAKMEAIEQMPRPTNISELRAFLGMNTKLHSNEDALSRLPVIAENTPELDVVDNYEVQLSETLPVTHVKLAKEIGKDKELQKWLLGRIKTKLGKLHYIVQLDNGKEWKRHVNQLRKIGEVPIQNENEEVDDYTPPDFQNKPVEIPFEPHVEAQENVQPPVQGTAEAQVNLPIPRRSQRQRTAPKLYNDFVTS
ncbi:hypothetical protein DMN91_011922 [Ooceraea biroi]|uniref:CCHC-type domain-containing protein n=1 Tax=Ooceraea biroi TaxID=2015173 RepID=A0A3L8D7V3_OOCBI|nr:hypothetical protein DMN91_011922 [Ooceraea biroi]